MSPFLDLNRWTTILVIESGLQLWYRHKENNSRLNRTCKAGRACTIRSPGVPSWPGALVLRMSLTAAVTPRWEVPVGMCVHASGRDVALKSDCSNYSIISQCSQFHISKSAITIPPFTLFIDIFICLNWYYIFFNDRISMTSRLFKRSF